MISRRPGERFNRGRIQAGGAAAPAAWAPTQITGVAAVWLAEDLSSVGDGGTVNINWVDRKNGYILAPFAADMGTYRATAFRNGAVTAGLEQLNKAARSTDAGLISILNGTNKSYAVITIQQLYQGNQHYYWSCGANGAVTTEYVACRFVGAGTVKNQMITRDGTINITKSADEFQALAPQMTRWERAGSTWNFWKDEIKEVATFVQADSGVLVEQFCVGATSAGTGTASSNAQISAVIVVDTSALPGNVMVAGDVTALATWVANRLGMQWKKGLTGGLWANTQVIWDEGQSNSYHEGRGTAPYTALTAVNAYAFFNDSYLRVAADPVGDATNNRYQAIAHVTPPTGSGTPALLNALYSGGAYPATDAIVMGGFGAGGTTAANWSNSAAAAIPVQNALHGVAFLRMIELMRNLPNPKILCHIIYQGESNSDTAPNAADWPTQWTIVADHVESIATSMGWQWVKTNLRHVVVELPDTPWTLGPQWATVKANQLSWVAGRAANTTISVKAPSGPYVLPDNLHLEVAAFASFGPTAATAIIAAT